MHRDGVEHALDRRSAGGALGDRVVGHALHHLEGVALLAAVLVDRHRRAEYRCALRPYCASGGSGESRSRSSDLRLECHTSQAARWPIGRKMRHRETGTVTDSFDAALPRFPLIPADSQTGRLGLAANGNGRRNDGEDRRALQAARLHLPVLRDLRRAGLDLRLRPLRRAAEEQREGRVVARERAGARRHGGPGRRDPHAPAHLGGLRPPRGLHRSPGAVPGRSARSAGAPTISARRSRRAS